MFIHGMNISNRFFPVFLPPSSFPVSSLFTCATSNWPLFFCHADFIHHTLDSPDLSKSCLQGEITLSSLGRVQTARSMFPAVPFTIICSLQLLIRIKKKGAVNQFGITG